MDLLRRGPGARLYSVRETAGHSARSAYLPPPRKGNLGPTCGQPRYFSDFGLDAPLFILVNVTETLEQQPKSRTRLIVAVTAVALVLGLLIFALTRGGSSTAEPSPDQETVVASVTPTPSPSETVTDVAPPAPATESASASVPASPTPSATETASADPRLAECTAVTEGFVPYRFSIEALDADESVIALDLDKDGNIAAPPFDQPRTASWWSGGPMPGSDAGKAVMSIHTYNPSLPPALGNHMYEGGQSQLKPGDVIKLYGRDGQVQCYEYTEIKKIWVDEYDPDSDVMVDFEGDPELAIVICWDFDSQTRDWDSRILFYFDPITPSA